MKNTIKIIAVILIVAMNAALLFGCSDKSGKNEKESKQVVLKWIVRGPGKQIDSDKVWAEFNNELGKHLPNTKVEFESITNSDFVEKWKLIASAGEEFDLVWTGWLLNYVDEIRKSAYLDLSDYIEKYGQDLKKNIPDYLWDMVRVDGKIYSIPVRQNVTSMRFGLRTHSELSSKYWDKNKAEEVFYSSKTMDENCYNVIEDYLKKIKDNGEIRKGFSSTFFPPATDMGYYPVYDNYYIPMDGDNKVVNSNLTDNAMLYYKKMSDWYKKGYIRSDVLSVGSAARQEEGKEEGYVMWVHNYYDNVAQVESQKYGFPIDVVPMVKENYISALQSNDSTAISRTSQNPERAMELLNLLYSEKGKELWNLLIFGLEGEHYNKISDTKIETLDYVQWPTKNSKYGMYSVAMGNAFNCYETQSEPDGWYENIEKMEQSAKKSPLLGFKLDVESIKNELAQTKVVVNEYRPQLRSGALDNVDATIEQFKAKLKTAGEEKIINEIQKQVDAFLKK